MDRKLWRYRAGWAICLAMLLVPRGLGAQGPPQPTVQEAELQVQEARARAAAGEREAQRAVVDQVLARWPDFAPAHWLAGHVWQAGAWREISAAQQANRWDLRLTEYRQRRDAVTSPADELALAQWCQAAGLKGRANLHFERVFVHPESDLSQRQNAAEALRLQPVDGLLLTAEQAQEYRTAQDAMHEAVHVWSPRLVDWQQKLASDRARQTQQAQQEIAAIDDPQLLLASLLLVGELQEPLAATLVPNAAAAAGSVSTYLLAEIALGPYRGEVRTAALTALKEKPATDYVPYLLNKLHSPIDARYRVFMDPLGNVRYLHDVLQSGRHENRQLQLQRGVNSSRLLTLPGSRTSRPTVIDLSPDRGTDVLNGQILASEGALRQWQVAAANQEIQRRNEPVFDVLEQLSGLFLKRDVESWQAWWDHQTMVDVNLQDKPTRYAFVDLNAGRQAFRPFAPSPFRHTTLHGDTPVWTELGVKPISAVRVGDRVLAQDVQTGEIAWQLVSRVIQQPPRQMLEVKFKDGAVIASPGQNFWRVGGGWTPAGKLKLDERIFGLDGLRHFAESAPVPGNSPTYSLVVNKYHTFFIGPDKLLVHDDTTSVAHDLRIPGLAK